MKAVEVGDGTTTDRDTPTLVSGGYKFTSISVGTSHTCGLLLSGEAICWGDNYHGQPGDGVDPSTRGFQDVYYPLTVAGGHKFAKIYSGWGYSCGLESDGTAYCRGDNSHCQLGITNYEPSPVKVVMEIQIQTATTLAATTTTTASTTTTTAGQCTMPGDDPPCGTIGLPEVISGINKWSAGTMTLSEVVALVNAWASG